MDQDVITTKANRPIVFHYPIANASFSGLTETFFAENVTRTTNKEG